MKAKEIPFLISIIATAFLYSGCDNHVPPAENEEEIIDKVTLTFTPSSSGGAPIVAEANDPDGTGVADFNTDDFVLTPGTEYVLTITVENTEEGENITEEIEEEEDEHLFFFAFTNDIFSDPAGNGNADDRSHPLNYEDEDDDGNGVGLTTSWTTSSQIIDNGEFRVILKHQPGIKSATSTAEDGSSDIDLVWAIHIGE